MQNPDIILGKKKVAVIGTGYVGATIAYALMIRNLAEEIVLVDIDNEKSKGEALDIQHGIPLMGSTQVFSGDYSDCKGCDLLILAVGRNRKPGETRLDMALDNVKIMKQVIDNLEKYYTKGVILVVTNPVDILVSKVSEWMKLPNGMVIGTGCILDTSRLMCMISSYCKISIEALSGYVVGEHGEGQIPIWSKVSVAGLSIDEYCKSVGLVWNEDERKLLSSKTKQIGMEIINKKGKTHYGIATCVCFLSEAILNHHAIIASVSTLLQGEYGVQDIALSLPSIIGTNGVEKRLEESWTQMEIESFRDLATMMKHELRTL